MTATFHYEFGSFLTWISTLGLAFFVGYKGRSERIARLHSRYTLLISVWAFFWWRMSLATTADQSLFFVRILHIPAAFIPATFLHFTQALLNVEKSRWHRAVRWMGYITGVSMASLSFSPRFVPSATPAPGFRFFGDAGPMYFLFELYFFIWVTFTLCLMAGSYHRQTPLRRLQLRYLLGAYGVGYLCATMVFLPIHKLRMPSLSLYGIVAAHVVMAYAILNYQLLNLRIFFRRMGLLSLIYCVLLMTLFPFIRLMHSHLGLSGAAITIVAAEILTVSFTLSLGPTLYAFFVHRSSYFHDETIAAVTHEIKSPLGAIEGALEILAAPTTSDLHRNEYLAVLRRNTERLTRYVNDLLRLYRPDAPAQALVEQEIDLCTLISEKVRQECISTNGNQPKIILDLPSQPLSIRCDQGKIGQVLSNLLSNAMKFARLGSVTISARRDSKSIRISVADTGEGIPAEDLPHVFERFFQGRKQRKRNRGSGVGLTIAKNWVEAHGGRIWAESEGEGKGTTVTFTLPAP